ncbi:Aldehyde/histidinol dehydrogenase [Phaeosphaeria sp. MPI-PUGE-AT-0046c]|nr:Aldehyde/histidinol dehydrogenase [Phaeosphaeria sp. MPI-PUGE-AT-0046c]
MSSPITPGVAISNLQSTALSARCHNVFFRQKQLKTLHDALRNNASEIKDALKQDTRASDAEITIEFALALETIKEHYNAINSKKELESEYLITNGKDAQDRSEPWGVTYIEPQQSHTPLFSIVAALGAALRAGNCIALKLENNLRALPALLRKLLPQAIEADTFAIIASAPSTEHMTTCHQVFQETGKDHPTYSQLVSSQGKVIAIVDRTADLPAAAEQLVAARFSFGGTSPYAPDIVLVNEFVKKEFLEHALRQSIRFLSGTDDVVANGSSKKSGPKASDALKTLQDTKSWKSKVITGGDNGAVVELTNLSRLPPKTSQPLFCIASITSLEHAISLVDGDLDPSESLAAAYHFGVPASGKYLSQFIRADASFVNHVPYRLLLGPTAPSNYPIDVEKRYTAQHFSRPSPAFISPSKSQGALQKVITGKDSRKAAAEMLAKATQEIKEQKRAESIAIGYFEQGIFIGLGVYGIPLLTCIGATLFFGVRAGLRRWVFA